MPTSRPALAAALCGSLALPGCGPSGPATQHRSAAGRFQVAFPAAFGTPAEQVRSWGRGAAARDVAITAATGPDGTALVAWSDHPGDGAPDLDRACRDAVAALGGTLRGDPESFDDARPSREFAFTAGSPTTPLAGRARVIADGRRVFQIVLLTPREADLRGKAGAEFFGSFAVLPAAPIKPTDPSAGPGSSGADSSLLPPAPSDKVPMGK
jgi:hypothetical protein